MSRKEDVEVIKLLTRAREDFQAMRKRMDNRIGRKADGSQQNIPLREIDPEDLEMFGGIANAAKAQEEAIEKDLQKVLKRFPVYTQYLKKVKGVGTVSAGKIIGEYNIEIATTVSKLWQFTGLNPGMVMGKKRVAKDKYKFPMGEIIGEIMDDFIVQTKTLIRGDKLTAGFIAPFNKSMRTAMVGVLADSFLKASIRYQDATQAEYDDTPEDYRRMKGAKPQIIKTAEGYGKIYLDYKHRLSNSENTVEEIQKKGGKAELVAWRDAKKSHRDRAAKRHMIKEFLKDLYANWREIEGLSVRVPYAEEYLGKKHAA